MRLGFDAHVLDGRDQGTKTLLLRLIEAIAEDYPEIDIFVYCERPHPDLDFSKSNLHFRETHSANAFHRLLIALPKAKRRDRLDTLAFNFISTPGMTSATVMIHDILPQTHPVYFSNKFVVRCWSLFGMSSFFSRKIFTISEYSKREIFRVYPWTRKKGIDVLHIGPSFPEATYLERGDGRDTGGDRYALCVGRIEARKNVQLAVDAFHKGSPCNVRLIIVGRREPGMALDLHGDSRIEELGGVSEADLLKLYRGASLFIYPSSAEGFGLPLLDAILFGIPTVSSARTSMAEVGGDAVEFFDPEEVGVVDWLADRIEGHFNSRPIAAPTAEQRDERRAKYSWKNSAKEFVAGLRR